MLLGAPVGELRPRVIERGEGEIDAVVGVERAQVLRPISLIDPP